MKIELFEFHDTAVRTVVKEGEVLFCGKDVAEILGYANSAAALMRHCKGVVKRYPLETPGGIQQMRFITEPDLYRLIASSKLPAAVEFEQWIFEEVLPSIRRHGGYLTGSKIEEALLNPDTLIQLAQNLKAEQEKRAALEAELSEAAPAVEYVEKFVATRDDAIKFRDAAADLGVRESVLRDALLAAKWCYRKSIGKYFSRSKQQFVEEFEYRAYADHMDRFVLRPQHNAPRLHNGQVRQTLYLSPSGVQAAARLLNGEVAA